MTIPVPTIDQFEESTVMTVIRNVVDYIIGLVPQINNGDVTDLTLNYQGSTLTVGFVKGDGTQISKNVTIESGGGATNPYPTDVSLSLSGSTLNCDILLSDNNHVTGSVDLSPLVPSVTGFVTEEELQQVQSDLQEQITGLKLSTSNNNMTLNGDSVQIVKTVSGTVSNGNLQITVNGVSSGDIPLPESVTIYHIKPIVTDKITYYNDQFTGYCMIYKVDDINSETYNFSVPNSLGYSIILDKVFINGISYQANTTLHLYKINYIDYASILTEAGYNTLPNGYYDIGLSVVEPFSSTSDKLVIGITMNERVTIIDGVLNKTNHNDAYIFSTKNNLENTSVTLMPYIIVRGS